MSSLAPATRYRQLIASVVRAPRPWQILLALLTLLVCYLAFTPMPPKQVGMFWDKINHMAAFTAMSFTACLGFPGPRRTVTLVLLGLLALGGSIELVQAFVPGRSCELDDLLADTLGIVTGAAIALPLLRLAGPRR